MHSGNRITIYFVCLNVSTCHVQKRCHITWSYSHERLMWVLGNELRSSEEQSRLLTTSHFSDPNPKPLCTFITEACDTWFGHGCLVGMSAHELLIWVPKWGRSPCLARSQRSLWILQAFSYSFFSVFLRVYVCVCACMCCGCGVKVRGQPVRDKSLLP